MSSSAPTARTRALVLRSIDYAEADRILTLLTERHGRLAVMVRGARSSRRRFGGALEPFAVVRVDIAEGRGQLGRLAGAIVERAHLRLLGRLEHMRQAGLAFEMVRNLLPDRQPEPVLFEDLVAFLSALDAEPDFGAPQELTLSVLGRALALLGFADPLEVCGACGRAPRPGQAVQFNATHNQLRCRACGGAPIFLSGRSRALLSATFGPGWLEAGCSPWPGEQLAQVRRALRATLEHCLEREVSLA